MNHAAYTALDVTQSDAVTTVSMNHPALNLLDDVLMPQLKRFVREVTSDASTRVIVFESALPEFFAAHGDINYVSGSNPTGMPHSASTTPLRPPRLRLGSAKR